ncbi:MAG TPA: hypothetical protein VMB85_18015 [Bryobacteraceae bacterium]|jgi:hypothetical protein|nr:hypothetical protein [Bryobacteraceae bacterium]
MVTGTVRSDEGTPIEGVLVMGADLNYSETGADGCFRLPCPEMALFFWCTGFLPRACPLIPGENRIEMVLHRTVAARAAGAGS